MTETPPQQRSTGARSPRVTPTELLARLERLGVRLSVENGELRIRAPKGVLTAELRDELARCKGELLGILGTADAASTSAIPRAPRDRPLPLSFQQQRIWFLDQLEPGQSTYNMWVARRLDGRLDVEAFERAMDEVIRRHEVLRTTFQDVDGIPRQVVAEPGTIRLEYARNELGLDQRDWQEEIYARMKEGAQRSFDLVAGPLFAPALFRVHETEHILFIRTHHTVVDGISVGLLLRELAMLYEAFTRGEPSPLPELEIQYADFAAWQRERFAGAELERQMGWWRERLSGDLPVLELPTDRPRPRIQTFRGATLKRDLPRDLIDAAGALGRARGATLFHVLLAAYDVLLHRITGQEDLIVGTAVDNRNRPEIEPVIGFFANTLALRADLSGDPSFRETLARVRDVCLGALDHQELPFEHLVDELAPERSLATTPVFQTFFGLDEDLSEDARFGDLGVGFVILNIQIAHNDLTIFTFLRSDGLAVNAEYNTDLFDRETIERLLESYETLLRSAVADPDQPISRLELLSEAERTTLLNDWNDTPGDYPREATIHRRFEEQVDRTPDAIAAVFPLDGGGDAGAERLELSYRGLDERANRLAQHLIAAGVGPGALVGLCLERSAEMLVAMFGILKTGAAYVPLDPAFPQERLAHMASDARLSLVVTQRRLAGLLPSDTRLVCVDEERAAIAARDAGRPRVDMGSDERMYVIYTSGSTGRPKGVEILHRSVSNFLSSMSRTPGLSAGERLLAVTTLSFDIAVLELVLPLVVGATVVVASSEAAGDADRLATLLARERPQVMQATPATWRMLVLGGWKGDRELRILCGGEALPRDLADALLARGREVWNLYGPTEATIWSTVARVEPGEGPITIGRPIESTRVYVLDGHLEPVPIGVTGELYLGGDGLARGYLDRPELTAERFLDDPFVAPGENARIYRTGDLGRWRADGTLECLGRVDTQVKVRGYRIELGEIEAVLGDVTGVRECVAVVREDTPGDRRLVAYLVTESGAAPSTGDLRAAARARLPEYMVPAAFVEVDALPLTPNGKVDRKALLAREGDGPSVETEYVEPRDDVERAIVAIWKEILGVDRVGVLDDFFELGGNSLLTTQVMARVRNTFGVDVQLRTMFEQPTAAALAERVAGAAPADAIPIPRVSRDGPLPLSFAQERLWFLDQLEPGQATYNMWVARRLRGALDVAALERTIAEIVRRHEVLRTRFELSDERPAQVIGDPDSIRLLTVVDEKSRPLDAWRAEVLRLLEAWAREPFDLARGPLFRATLVRVSDEEHVLFLVAHHTVMDGLSIGLLLGELRTLYEAFTRGEPSPLPELPIQYADYAAWQRKRLHGAELERQMEWWRERLSGDLPVLELPADRPRPAIQTYRGATRKRHLPRSLIDAAGELGRSGGATLFHVLLAAYDALLRRVSGQEDVIVGTAVGNRGRTETEPVMGFFTNTLALRADLSGDPSFRETVARVRDVCLGALDHQELPFERLVDELAPERSLATTPIFQTFFVLDEDLGEETRIGDLTVDFVDLDIQVAHTDLTVLTYLGREGLVVSAEYNTDLFDGETIAELLETYEVLLKSAVADPDRPIGRLAILAPTERTKLLHEWNDTRTDYPRESTIQAQFEARAQATPDAVAAVLATVDALGGAGAAHSLTYGELNRHANRLAHHLRSLGVGPDDLVGLCTERSLAMLVGILGILKAGGAYLPLDPGYPRDRLALMIADARMSVLLTQDSLRGSLPPFEGEVFCLDSDWPTCERESDADPEPRGGPRNLAYAMFTSGSTGRPKGVCVEHRSVLRLVSRPNFARLDADEVLLHFAPISFDASTLEVWGALLNGARVVVYPPSAPSLEDLGRVIRENGVTTAWLTAGLFALMVDQRLEDLRGLRQLLAGGDVLPIPQVNRVLEELPHVRLINGYGPTENTTFTCCHQISDGGRVEGSVPIGRPVSDTRVYVLDGNQELVPIGVPGELLVAGDGLARGYLERPEQTEERFVANPFEPGERMYRTGDVVRWRRDGTIEFIGRRDDQVKVRGFRIELGEIEVVLGAHADVRECVVTVREDVPGDKRLVAYVVPEGERVDVAALRRSLKERLPEYMNPAAYVTLDALPLSPNGKVDRAALPAPDEARRDVETAFEAPRNETERRIASIWSEALGLERVGIHDNFFDLGGNSLLTTRVMSDVRASFGAELPLRHLFEDPTVAGLAGRIDNGLSDVARRRYESEFEASLIPLQPRGSRTPLFLVSGAHANEDDFLRFVGSLLPHMGTDQPIYGFKARGLDGVRRPHQSAEEMAADYVNEMRALQPEGPYVLAGNCVGGIVAYEMAQQLRRAGCEVALVALLDTTRPEENYAAFVENHYRFWKRERFAGHWKEMDGLSALDKFRYVLGKVEKKLSSTFPLTERARRTSRIERVERKYSRILARYRAEPYSGRVALIVNEELQRELPDGGWRDVIQDGLETHVVSGDHVTRLSMNGQDTADVLRSCIDRALARSTAQAAARA